MPLLWKLPQTNRNYCRCFRNIPCKIFSSSKNYSFCRRSSFHVTCLFFFQLPYLRQKYFTHALGTLTLYVAEVKLLRYTQFGVKPHSIFYNCTILHYVNDARYNFQQKKNTHYLSLSTASLRIFLIFIHIRWFWDTSINIKKINVVMCRYGFFISTKIM